MKTAKNVLVQGEQSPRGDIGVVWEEEELGEDGIRREIGYLDSGDYKVIVSRTDYMVVFTGLPDEWGFSASLDIDHDALALFDDMRAAAEKALVWRHRNGHRFSEISSLSISNAQAQDAPVFCGKHDLSKWWQCEECETKYEEWLAGVGMLAETVKKKTKRGTPGETGGTSGWKISGETTPIIPQPDEEGEVVKKTEEAEGWCGSGCP